MTEKNYIDILKRDLKKKNLILEEIMAENQNQKQALENPNLDPDDFDEIVEKKAGLIEQLGQLDNGFEQVYEHVREELNGHKELYKEDIREMQNLIRQLTEKSAEIQVQELRNKELMEKKFTDVKQQIREVRASHKVVNQYYQNMMKTNYIDPQFMDNKK